MPAPDSQVDTRGHSAVCFTMDFSPTTLEEAAAHNGDTRANAPVGAAGESSYVNPFTSLRAADEIPAASRIKQNKRW